MKITIIGTGNLAYHLSKKFFAQGVDIQQVIGRNPQKALALAEEVGARYTTYFEAVDPTSDLYIIAVSDNSIEDVAMQLALSVRDKLVVHTSGTVSSRVLSPYFDNYGTLYPLQTFSRNRTPDFGKIPIFIQVTPPQYNLEFLTKIARFLSPNVHQLSDADRQTLHLAAVFVNNFANHLFKIGHDIVAERDLPFQFLQPLIEETVQKISNNSPESMQTGPAKRGDDGTIEQHLDYLEHSTLPQYELIYAVLSASINPNLGLNKPN